MGCSLFPLIVEEVLPRHGGCLELVAENGSRCKAIPGELNVISEACAGRFITGLYRGPTGYRPSIDGFKTGLL